jgi:cell division protein FtsZ
LFRRITGFGLVRPSAEQAPEQPRGYSPQQQAAINKATTAMQQAKLAIDPTDRPAQSQTEEDILDIPAFLRRQTNH